ncbi:MAG TPA: MarR family transcriptional regulator [Chloroflexota bacterium]|nr:MarR family transcriptional regulator [Chloroflexota bacterium]
MSETNLVATEIIRTIPAVMRLVAAELRKQQSQLVPAQLGVLGALAERSCNLSELAELSGVSLPTMSGTVSHLVAQGLVKRSRAAHDRRMIMLELTPDGRTQLNHLGQHIIGHLADLLAPLSPAELDTLQNGLRTLQKVFPPWEPFKQD